MSISPKNSILIVIDVQENLVDLIENKKLLLRNLSSVIEAAKILNIPIIYTEQVPEKIGKTIPEIAIKLKEAKRFEKKAFSCYKDKNFIETLKSNRKKNIIICGIESHVCIYQTARDLMAAEYNVHVVSDAISSRASENDLIAQNRMANEGAVLTCTEMLLTELLATSEHQSFKEILQLFK